MNRNVFLHAAERIFDGSETFACIAIRKCCRRRWDDVSMLPERELFELIYGVEGYRHVFSDMVSDLFKKDAPKTGLDRLNKWHERRLNSAGISGYQEVRILALLFVREMLRTRSISLKDFRPR